MANDYLDVAEIAPTTRLLFGRPLDFQKGEVDIANALVHKEGDTVFVVDTGATGEFRRALKAVADDLGPFEEAVVLTTHAHADHVSNNNLLDDLDSRSKRHFVSGPDLAALRDNTTYFAESFGLLQGVVDQAADPEGLAAGFMKMVGSFDSVTAHTELFESRRLEPLRIGDQRWSGWTFADGKVAVLRTQGHCAGQVIVWFPGLRHLHMSDETTGACQSFHDCDHVKHLDALSKSLGLLEAGAIDTLSDGHTFELFDRAGATEYLTAMVDDFYDQDNAIIRILSEGPPGGMTLGELAEAKEHAPELRNGPAGANPNPLFDTLVVVQQLRELGAVASDGDPPKRTYRLTLD